MVVRYKAVLSDVDGTLYSQWRVRRRVAAQLLQFVLTSPLVGVRTVRALRAYRRAQETLRDRGATGYATRQIEEAARQCVYDHPFVAASVHEWMEVRPLDSIALARATGLTEFCVWAQTNDVRLGIVSDYDAGPKLRVLGLDRYFPVVVCAQDPDVGVFKPNPRGIRLALERLGVAPDQAIYVGDRPEVDGAAAEAAGVTAVILTDAASWRPVDRFVAVRDWEDLRRQLASGLPLATLA